MVPLAEKAGVNHFSVFSSDEAMPWAMRNRISFYVTCLDRLRAAATVR